MAKRNEAVRQALIVAVAAIVSSSGVALAKLPPVIKKPPTKWTLGGTSLSKITDEQIDAAVQAALVPLGYKVGSVGASTACVWEGRFLSVEKATSRFFIFVKRPWLTPDEPCDPKSARGPGDEAFNETVAHAYDKKAEVIAMVSPNIDGTTTPEQKTALVADAKQIFDLLFKAQGAAAK